jgi:pyruvate kinase
MQRDRSTKIVATLGPASSSREKLRALFEAGADVFRLNFSHGTHDDHRQRVELLRGLEKEFKYPIGILMDLQGPKLRLGTFAKGPMELKKGQKLRFDMDAAPGTAKRVPLLHPEIFRAAKPDGLLLVDDGRVRLRITAHDEATIDTVVEVAGPISDRKGVNLPNLMVPLSPMTDKDHKDLAYGLSLGVARGDLGVEMPPEAVPPLQKRILAACRVIGRPAIVATQMLESMVHSPTPTRAEASDVATAVYDGADAVMLSAESASGDYPVEAVTIMDRILKSVERDPLYRRLMDASRREPEATTADAISAAARQCAHTLSAAAIVTYTTTGSTTLRAARERPDVRILCLTPNLNTARRMTLTWGVHARHTEDAHNFADMVARAVRVARQDKIAKEGERLVITAGVPFGTPGATNILRIAYV